MFFFPMFCHFWLTLKGVSRLYSCHFKHLSVLPVASENNADNSGWEKTYLNKLLYALSPKSKILSQSDREERRDRPSLWFKAGPRTFHLSLVTWQHPVQHMWVWLKTHWGLFSDVQPQTVHGEPPALRDRTQTEPSGSRHWGVAIDFHYSLSDGTLVAVTSSDQWTSRSLQLCGSTHTVPLEWWFPKVGGEGPLGLQSYRNIGFSSVFSLFVKTVGKLHWEEAWFENSGVLNQLHWILSKSCESNGVQRGSRGCSHCGVLHYSVTVLYGVLRKKKVHLIKKKKKKSTWRSSAVVKVWFFFFLATFICLHCFL